jgi:bifunctional DNA-binding transcriptional regulator/antitoxin component of YhaV-PrlF toxin-antitoxin module
MHAVLKEIDDQGRIVIPAEWRKKWLRGKKVILRSRGEVLEILPRENVDLTAFFDRVEVDTKADLSDWHAVRRELRKK